MPPGAMTDRETSTKAAEDNADERSRKAEHGWRRYENDGAASAVARTSRLIMVTRWTPSTPMPKDDHEVQLDAPASATPAVHIASVHIDRCQL